MDIKELFDETIRINTVIEAEKEVRVYLEKDIKNRKKPCITGSY